MQVLNIGKRFGAVTALKDASLSLAPGEIRALLGANGSGKSTLVKVLGGMINPDGGRIIFNDKPLIIKSPGDARKHGIAVAYQDLSLVPKLTVAENILLGQEPVHRFGFIEKKQVLSRSLEILEELHVNAHPESLAGSLDPASQSMVEVAKALAWKPRILVLDEVTASLHHNEVDRLFHLLRMMRSEGLAILFVSHRFDEVFALCSTATVIRSGETVAAVDIADVDEAQLVYLMTGKHPELARNIETTTVPANQNIILSVDRAEIQPKVKDVSLHVGSGEIVGLAGLQGQGQAEFLRAVYGLIPFSGGSMSFCNKAMTFPSPQQAVGKGLGFISGDREREGILPVRSVLENLFQVKLAFRRLTGILKLRVLETEAQRMIERLRIVSGGIHHPANSLSGGNQQKLIVGRWLMAQPKLLLLDDPTKGVDISARREIHEILREMARAGVAIIISSSDNQELLEIAERIYVFYEGRITSELTEGEKAEGRLIAAMLGMEPKGGDE